MAIPLSKPSRQCSAGLAALLIWVATTESALASIPAPSSHAVLSTDGKRLLVMVSPDVDYDRKSPVHFALPTGATVILHEAFTKSGCYDAATLIPIWQADWFAYRPDLRWSPDFSDVACINRGGLSSDWALAFYHEGKLLRRYDCEHLLAKPNHWSFFQLNPSGWHPLWYDTFEIRTNQLVLSTASRRLNLWFYSLDLGVQETHTFDLSSGAVIGSVSAGVWRIRFYEACGLLIVILVPLGFYLRRRVRREQAALAERET